VLNSCDDWFPVEREDCITFFNSSDKSVYIIVSYTYPDTLISNDYLQNVKSQDEECIAMEYPKEDFKFFKELPSDTLCVFVFSRDTILKYGWIHVYYQYMIMKRYELSKQDLEEMNWTITYP
jgi:hypothetical protein